MSTHYPRLEPFVLAGALCARADVDPEWWHPSTSVLGPQNRKALAVCQQCPEVVACLDYALPRHVAGIWGGTTEADRRAIMRGRRTA